MSQGKCLMGTSVCYNHVLIQSITRDGRLVSAMAQSYFLKCFDLLLLLVEFRICYQIEVAKVVETQANLEKQLELIEAYGQEVKKVLESMEEEAERVYKDESGLLLEDEAASTRDAMYEQAEFRQREMEQMTEKIKSTIQTLNANQVMAFYLKLLIRLRFCTHVLPT